LSILYKKSPTFYLRIKGRLAMTGLSPPILPRSPLSPGLENSVSKSLFGAEDTEKSLNIKGKKSPLHLPSVSSKGFLSYHLKIEIIGESTEFSL